MLEHIRSVAISFPMPFGTVNAARIHVPGSSLIESTFSHISAKSLHPIQARDRMIGRSVEMNSGLCTVVG